jgi:hypothetical protein
MGALPSRIRVSVGRRVHGANSMDGGRLECVSGSEEV